jgi:hypothetical protein
MEKLLLLAALACGPGDQLVDFRSKIPPRLKFVDLIVSVEPFYTRFYIYQPGYADSIQQCCSGKPSGVLRVPVIDGRYCIRRSQPQMKWNVRAVLRPDLEM